MTASSSTPTGGAPAAKKMNLMQLTFIVAVNMMGSGIIMLPTNMAQVGAISLLSWIVTAVGSMAIAYGFAQAGLFNQRRAAWRRTRRTRTASRATSWCSSCTSCRSRSATSPSRSPPWVTWRLSSPGCRRRRSRPAIGVIGLLWLTTVANFGGPSVTGQDRHRDRLGRHHPGGPALDHRAGSGSAAATFAAAWNPQGLSLGAGMGSSIALTLWAFLGMESAAQNSDAVENPKRNVPLACMFGTLGAAVIYILSTTVIQGIVPNAELANSTGPFGLAYAQMFNPTVGSIIMALAVMACLGSLLGWQFTIAQTAQVGGGRAACSPPSSRR